MSKRITFLCALSLEDPNGTGRYFPFAKELVRQGHSVTIIALHGDYYSLSAAQRSFKKDGVSIHYAAQMHVLKRGDHKFYFNKTKLFFIAVLAVLKMAWYGLCVPSDILYCFKLQPINSLATLIIKIIKWKNRIFLDCSDYESGSGNLNALERRIFQWFEYLMPRTAHTISYHSSYLKDRLDSIGCGPKCVHLPNGIDRVRLEKIFDRNIVENLQQRINPMKKKIILYFGSLSLAGGHAIDLLISAFSRLEQPDKALLVIIGGGEDIDRLKTQSSDNESIIFTGKVDPMTVMTYVACAYLSVDPVRASEFNEGRYPLKIVESIAAGVPVITSDIGDRRSILNQERAGLLVRPGDEKDLCKGLTRLLNDEQLRDNMSHYGSTIFRKNFCWDQITQRFLTNVTESHGITF